MAPKQIFVNLPVADVNAATNFYTAIGATKNTMFCDETTSCMVFSDTIFVMIMTRERFAGFCPKDKVVANALSIEGNAKAVSEVLLFLSADSKEEVDEILEKAGKAGGKKDPTTFPEADFMYGRSFEDLDGHVFEIGYMDMEKMKEGGHKTCE